MSQAKWGTRGELLAAAICTALGKRAEARAIFIGTRPASDSHFFARLLAEDDPSVYAQVHAAGPDDPPFRMRSIRKANPALEHGLPDIKTLRAEMRLAKRDPAVLAMWRILRLNQGTSGVESQGVRTTRSPIPARRPVQFSSLLRNRLQGRRGRRVVLDTKYDIIQIMTRVGRLLDTMKANPKADWAPENVRTVVRAHGLTLRQ